MSDAHGNALPNVGNLYDNVIVSVRIVLGNHILDDQLTGLTTRVVRNGEARFSGLAAPALTGKQFRLQFILQDASGDVLKTAYTDEFSLRPSGLFLNNTLPHTLSGMVSPAVSVKLMDRTGAFVNQMALPDEEKAVEIALDLVTTRYVGCSRAHPTSNTISASWSTCARVSALAQAAFFFIGPDAVGQSTCGYAGSLSLGCLDDSCWHSIPATSVGCRTAGCAKVVEDDGSICNASHGFRFFALLNSSALLDGTLRTFAVGGQAIFKDIKFPSYFGKAACLLLFSDDGIAEGSDFTRHIHTQRDTMPCLDTYMIRRSDISELEAVFCGLVFYTRLIWSLFPLNRQAAGVYGNV